MRAAFIRTLLLFVVGYIGLFGFALFRTSPWSTIGMGICVIATVLLIFAMRDLIHLICLRFGLQASKGTVFTHLCAALMAAVVYLLTFGSSDPRVDSVKWTLLICLPLGMYAFSWIYDRLRLIGNAPKSRKRGRKQPPAN
ncbi:MAG: hypothetical protein JWR56_2389 [Massilia sp.]|jgi:hypothetical protein|nr:hypothetical protein [Massilia sp.]